MMNNNMNYDGIGFIGLADLEMTAIKQAVKDTLINKIYETTIFRVPGVKGYLVGVTETEEDEPAY